MVPTDDQVKELTNFRLEAKALGHFELDKGLGEHEETRMGYAAHRSRR